MASLVKARDKGTQANQEALRPQSSLSRDRSLIHHTHHTHYHTCVISLFVPEVYPLKGSWDRERGRLRAASPITPPQLTVGSLPPSVSPL